MTRSNASIVRQRGFGAFTRYANAREVADAAWHRDQLKHMVATRGNKK